MLSFKPTFSLSSFTFIKRLFSSSPFSAIRVPYMSNLGQLWTGYKKTKNPWNTTKGWGDHLSHPSISVHVTCLPSSHIRNSLPHLRKWVSKLVTCFCTILYYSMGLSKGLPEFLVAPCINIYWFRRPGALVSKKYCCCWVGKGWNP